MTTTRRRIYAAIIALHPLDFRDRFGQEMLLDFEDVCATHHSADLYLDALQSAMRQWASHFFPSAHVPLLAEPSLLSGQYISLSQASPSAFELVRASCIAIVLFGSIGFATVPRQGIGHATNAGSYIGAAPNARSSVHSSAHTVSRAVISQTSIATFGLPIMSQAADATPETSYGLELSPAITYVVLLCLYFMLRSYLHKPRVLRSVLVALIILAIAIPAHSQAKQTATIEPKEVQDLSGSWQGTLAGDIPRRILFKVSHDGSGAWTGVLYELDRAPRPLVPNDFLIYGRDFEFAVGAINIRFAGKLDANASSATGLWKEAGISQPLILKHESEATAWVVPEPKPRLKVPANAVDTAYEVATVKPASPYAQGSGMRVSGRQLEALNMSLSDLIEFSYEIHKSQIESAPDWISREKFDATLLYPGDTYPNDIQCKAMVKQLLAERFGLTFHRAHKELIAFSLTVSKGGPKLAKSEGDPNGLPGMRFSAPGVFGAQNTSMADFANELQRSVMNRPVVDNTGLQGRFDFGLEWAPDELQFGGRPVDQNANSGKPDLMKALKEQLGLRLESTKTTVATFSIDQADKPTEN